MRDIIEGQGSLIGEKVRHRTGAELIHKYWQKQAKKQIEEMKKKNDVRKT